MFCWLAFGALEGDFDFVFPLRGWQLPLHMLCWLAFGHSPPEPQKLTSGHFFNYYHYNKLDYSGVVIGIGIQVRWLDYSGATIINRV